MQIEGTMKIIHFYRVMKLQYYFLKQLKILLNLAIYNKFILANLFSQLLYGQPCNVISPIVRHILIEHLQVCNWFFFVSKGVLIGLFDNRTIFFLEILKKLGKIHAIWRESVKCYQNDSVLSHISCDWLVAPLLLKILQ